LEELDPHSEIEANVSNPPNAC